MAFKDDGIPRSRCFSVTDFHEFENCAFKFFVFHHLGKKYELSEGNYNMALGSLLDETIKLFHRSKAYGLPAEYLPNLVKASCNKMREKIGKSAGPSFFSLMESYLNEEMCQKASEIFVAYYKALNGKIKRSLGEVDFGEWIVVCEGDNDCKLWGWPDTYELGEDGIPEVCDYKYREDIEKGKNNMDMYLMPKAYMMLASKYLLSKGYKKARFVVRFWMDPLENSFSEEFDLAQVSQHEDIFKQKMLNIINTKELTFCEKPYCQVCNAATREQYVLALQKLGVSVSKAKDDFVLQEELLIESVTT